MYEVVLRTDNDEVVLLGDSVGLMDGLALGDSVGPIVGLAVGFTLGLLDGISDGLEDGLELGDAEGDLVGDVDGDVDGLADGLEVGANDEQVPYVIALSIVVRIAAEQKPASAPSQVLEPAQSSS